MRTALCLSLAFASLLWALPAPAQTLESPRPRQGYYGSLGLYGAGTQVRDHGENLGFWGGSAFSLRTGQMLTESLGLGIEFNFGGTSSGPESAAFGGLALDGQWNLGKSFALRGGVGLAVLTLQDERVVDEESRGTFGGAYSLALTYDWFLYEKKLSGGFALTPILAVRYLPGDQVHGVFGMFGLEITYWGGLPSNELDLPAGEGYDP